MLVYGGEGAKAKAAGNLLIRGGVAVLLREAGEKVDDFFLPSCNSHAEIVANKRRIAITLNDYPFDARCVGFSLNKQN